MTIKQDIQRSAEQLGRSVRQALEDFSRETGMQAQLNVEWITVQQMNEACPTQVVGRISVEVAGLTVEV